jgi:membrane protein
MIHSVFDTLSTTFKRFGEDRCFNFSVTVSYFALLCSIPLVGLFIFLTTKILGSEDIAINSLNILSDEFFAKMDPLFFERVQFVSRDVSNLSWFGLGGSFIAASFMFSNLLYAINYIFRAHYQKSFFYNRLMEYLIMFVIGIIMLISLSITVIWTGLERAIRESTLFAEYVNPKVMSLVNNFFLQYLIPITLTFLVFFILYKFIPEIKVYTRPAAVAALASTLLWEVFKRIFAFYVAHFSAVGVVLTRLVQGTLTSIIFFLLWITLSLAILFWGAELAAVLNERYHEKTATG